MGHPAIDIDKLAPEERLRLIGDLWKSLRDKPASVSITHAQRRELDLRLDELEDGAVELVSWDEVKRRLRDHTG